jgi:hypothetical protein
MVMAAKPPTTGETGTEYTLEHAEDHIAGLVGLTDRMGEIQSFTDSQVPDVTLGVGNGSQLYSVGGAPQGITAVGLAGAVPITIGDSTNFVVTQATDNQASQSFTVPGNDANVGTTYRLSVWGSATEGSTSQALTWSLYFGGSSRAAAPVGGGQWSASAGIRWKIILIAQCVTTGAGGTWTFSIEGSMSLASGNLLAGVGANGTIGFATGTGANVSVDTTAANSMLLEAAWASTTGAPTLTSRGSLFERLGA